MILNLLVFELSGSAEPDFCSSAFVAIKIMIIDFECLALISIQFSTGDCSYPRCVY